MKIIVTGATGMVGTELVRQAIADPAVEEIVALVRSNMPFSHPKLRELIHTDFLNFEGLEEIFRDADACVWCLGISQLRVPAKEYIKITYCYTVKAAAAIRRANPAMRFIFLSAAGADMSGRWPARFAKVKGRTERALTYIGPAGLTIFRPGGILATVPPQRPHLYKRFERFMLQLLALAAPFAVVSTAQLAKAMLSAAKRDPGKLIIGHRAIRNMR